MPNVGDTAWLKSDQGDLQEGDFVIIKEVFEDGTVQVETDPEPYYGRVHVEELEVNDPAEESRYDSIEGVRPPGAPKYDDHNFTNDGQVIGQTWMERDLDE